MSEKNSSSPHRKVVIVGAGAVGSTFAYALAIRGVAEEIVLSDLNRDLAEGQALDLSHGLPFLASARIRAGDKADYADADVIVITAGAKQESGESRLDLLSRNARIMNAIVDDILSADSPAVVVNVTNPVDILTHVGIQRSGWDQGRFFGSGTVLDSARLRYLIGRDTGVDMKNVHAYVLGEHGDSEIAAWSITNIAGMSLDQYCPICDGVCNGEYSWPEHQKKLLEKVRKSAYHIIDYKGATNFAVGLALVEIIGAVLRNENRIMTVSTLLKGEYGLADVCLSVPCRVNRSGIAQVIETDLSEEELKGLRKSGEILRRQLDDLGTSSTV